MSPTRKSLDKPRIEGPGPDGSPIEFDRTAVFLRKMVKSFRNSRELPNKPEFWLLLAACAAGESANLSESQKALRDDAELAFEGLTTSLEFQPLLNGVERTLSTIADFQTASEPKLVDLNCGVATHRLSTSAKGFPELQQHRWVATTLSEQFRKFLEECDWMTRIRRCQNCPRIFWATRANQRICDRACANRAGFRKWYEDPKHKEQLKVRRNL
jgi:hypothetical protein